MYVFLCVFGGKSVIKEIFLLLLFASFFVVAGRMS